MQAITSSGKYGLMNKFEEIKKLIYLKMMTRGIDNISLVLSPPGARPGPSRELGERRSGWSIAKFIEAPGEEGADGSAEANKGKQVSGSRVGDINVLH